MPCWIVYLKYFDVSFLTIDSYKFCPVFGSAIILNSFCLLGLQHHKKLGSVQIYTALAVMFLCGPAPCPSFTVIPCSGKGMVWNCDESESCPV